MPKADCACNIGLPPFQSRQSPRMLRQLSNDVQRVIDAATGRGPAPVCVRRKGSRRSPNEKTVIRFALDVLPLLELGAAGRSGPKERYAREAARATDILRRVGRLPFAVPNLGDRPNDPPPR
jgi:hypothetical protein